MSADIKTPRRKFVGRKTASSGPNANNTTSLVKHAHGASINRIPDDILNDPELNQAVSILPSNYNFEIHKTIWHIRRVNAKRVALQMPEGLLIYSCIISDIIEQFCGAETVVMGDVTYGACCIDDYTALALECDFLVHYAHSCLVPIDVTRIKVLYVFVTIDIDKSHLVATLTRNFEKGTNLVLVSTIQFNPTIHQIVSELESHGLTTTIPQAKPLSRGEILGCTAPRLTSDEAKQAIVYVGDGRFHLESIMIHNPDIPAFKYDPYNREFTKEEYAFDEMHQIRREAISAAANAKKIGLILGSLGRQGNNATLDRLESAFKEKGIETFQLVLSEIFPDKLAMFSDVDCWVQVACPRLSIDWGYAYPQPLLTPYEAMVSLGQDSMWTTHYPMDYYTTQGYGRGKKPDRTCC